MRRILTITSLAIAAVASARVTKIGVKVIQIAGGRAYLSPGSDAGLAPGTEVELHGRRFKILSVTSGHAVIDPGDVRLAEGDKGTAAVASGAVGTERLPAPLPLTRWAGQWHDPSWPADAQTPKPQPLGPMRAPGSLRLLVLAQAFGAAGDGPASGHLSLEARGSFQPWGDKPFAADADATVLAWLADERGPVAGVQQALRVDELRLRWGTAADPLVALGRLRWAARNVGLLDGARLRSPLLGNFTLGAFGGFVPDVVTGRPATDASRFGAEITWADPRGYARPRATLTAYGSMFGGALDERRLALALDATPGAFVLAARGELSMFDADNPWGAAELELTSWGADATARAGGWHAGAHVDVRQPERSRYLASLLPPSWLCTARPRPAGPPEPCDGVQGYRTVGAIDAGWDSPAVALSAGAAAIFDQSGFAEQSFFADVRLLRILGRGHAGVGASGVHGSVLDQMAVRVEAGALFFHDRLDLSVYWRGAQLSYLAATEDLLEHRVGADAAFTVGPRLDVVLTVEGTTGPDVSGVVGLATCIWRPLP